MKRSATKVVAEACCINPYMGNNEINSVPEAQETGHKQCYRVHVKHRSYLVWNCSTITGC